MSLRDRPSIITHHPSLARQIKAFSLAKWRLLDVEAAQAQQQQPPEAWASRALPIGNVHPNALGTRVIYTVASAGAYLHDPLGAGDADLMLPDFPFVSEKPPVVLWDVLDR